MEMCTAGRVKYIICNGYFCLKYNFEISNHGLMSLVLGSLKFGSRPVKFNSHKTGRSSHSELAYNSCIKIRANTMEIGRAHV